MNITIRAMTLEDTAMVADLLQANSAIHHGGLFGEFPNAKVTGMYQSSLHSIIALDQSSSHPNNVAGVLFSFPVNSPSLPPIAQEINRRFPAISQNNWFYGPVCIAEHYRGQSLLIRLYQQMCQQNSGQAVAFINSDNIASLKAHQKIGMQKVAEFELLNKRWLVMCGE
ncbi:GNAT family N-acetyltransferase [Moellerella wisconsensis]|uniref:Acetyltransferase n=1 Tax=Moellerella wisconsensis ATCC 35017 TaxID=1354267 RepID=A0A0N0IA95_9GAMM|nr:acetyltransferase [Moellerella wisconsensis]KPD02852.1 acetyltransferase [Moellerella wisconsensis ATCC 35017]VFS53645.1 Uncharacterised protein [Moellerella wisconsensis]